jgi:hypothetical protein
VVRWCIAKCRSTMQPMATWADRPASTSERPKSRRTRMARSAFARHRRHRAMARGTGWQNGCSDEGTPARWLSRGRRLGGGGVEGGSAQRLRWRLVVSYCDELQWSYSQKEVISGGSRRRTCTRRGNGMSGDGQHRLATVAMVRLPRARDDGGGDGTTWSASLL